MNRSQVVATVAYLEELAGRDVSDPRAAIAWFIEVESAIVGTFPETHAVRKRWERVLEHRSQVADIDPDLMSHAEGVLDAALNIVRSGRLVSMIQGIRTETVGEVLDQAESLLDAGHVVAAAVLAGGALETHLRHVCGEFGVIPVGKPSIESFRQALDTARKTQPMPINQSMTKQIGGWADIRNDAAHRPAAFVHDYAAVAVMIAGIKLVVAS